MNFSAASPLIGLPLLSCLACRDRLRSHREVRTGFTRSSTTASASWLGAMRAVFAYSRNGFNLGDRFPKIAATVESLPVGSCVTQKSHAGPLIECTKRGSEISNES